MVQHKTGKTFLLIYNYDLTKLFIYKYVTLTLTTKDLIYNNIN